MNRAQFWILLVIAYCLTFLVQYTLISDALYIDSLSRQFTYEQIENLLVKGKKWEWLGYVLLPFVYLLRCALVASCLSLGFFFMSNRFEFGKMFQVAVQAEFVLLIPAVLKIGWFLFIQTNYSLQDLQTFYPLSVLSIFDHTTLEPWLLYPLQVLNVFEVVYWVGLAWGISKQLSGMDMNRSINVVVSGYLPALAIWVAVVMFLTLTYT